MKPVRVNIEDLPNNTKTPMLTYCRKLIAEGANPKSKLHFFREGQDTPDVVILHLGKAAELTVGEEPKPHFRKFVPFSASGIVFKQGTSPSRIDGSSVVATQVA